MTISDFEAFSRNGNRKSIKHKNVTLLKTMLVFPSYSSYYVVNKLLDVFKKQSLEFDAAKNI